MAQQISIVPHPVTDVSRIEVPAQIGSAQVYDLFGRVLKRESISNHQQGIIRRTDFVPGTYFCKLICRNREVYWGR